MTTQAVRFGALMEAVWEGGDAYDLAIENGKAENAVEMFRALFPSSPCEPFGEGGLHDVTFPDASRAFLGTGEVQQA